MTDFDSDDPFGPSKSDETSARERSDSAPVGWEFVHEEEGTPAQPAATRRPRVIAIVSAAVVAILVIVAVVAIFRWIDGDRDESASPLTVAPTSANSPIGAGPDTGGRATTALKALPVKTRTASADYDRAAFGPDWADVDDNGCDTRNDILNRYLTAKVYEPGTSRCVVESGLLNDPYSGRQISFERGYVTSAEVQVDHVVALSNAWQTGADSWTNSKRLRFANDPLNLLPVDGELNMQKSDGDAATWLPPNKSYRCDYVARQIAVKAKYSLWVTLSEGRAMERVLSKCPNERLPR